MAHVQGLPLPLALQLHLRSFPAAHHLLVVLSPAWLEAQGAHAYIYIYMRMCIYVYIYSVYIYIYTYIVCRYVYGWMDGCISNDIYLCIYLPIYLSRFGLSGKIGIHISTYV